MWKGITPKNMDELQKIAYSNNDEKTFNNAVVAMNAIQTFKTKPLFGDGSQTEYIRAYEKGKVTGLTPAQVKIEQTIAKDYKTDVALAKNDVNQLSINNGEFTSILSMKDANGHLSFKDIKDELAKRISGKQEQFVNYSNNGKSILSKEESTQLGEQIASDPETAPGIIRGVYSSVGPIEATKIFKDMYPKKVNGVIYSAVIANDKPVIANDIVLGINAEKNGAKLTTDQEKEYNDYIRSDSTLATLGESAPGIRQAIRGYYFSMPTKNMDEAVKAVTNGIDNGIIVYKPGLSYDDVYDNITNTVSDWDNGYKVGFKQRMNGVPTANYDTFIDNLKNEKYKLVTVSQRGYAFKTKDLGTYVTNTAGKKLVFTFRGDD